MYNLPFSLVSQIMQLQIKVPACPRFSDEFVTQQIMLKMANA